ncbi:MAG: hypothetical protein ACRC6I_18260, partial [Paracoccaceae bacterium]
MPKNTGNERDLYQFSAYHAPNIGNPLRRESHKQATHPSVIALDAALHHLCPMELAGKLLIAMPGMGDPRFAHTVIFVCANSPEGSMG